MTVLRNYPLVFHCRSWRARWQTRPPWSTRTSWSKRFHWLPFVIPKGARSTHFNSTVCYFLVRYNKVNLLANVYSVGDNGPYGKLGRQGDPGPKGQKGQEGQGRSGVSYVRWGRTRCEGDGQIVYTGECPLQREIEAFKSTRLWYMPFSIYHSCCFYQFAKKSYTCKINHFSFIYYSPTQTKAIFSRVPLDWSKVLTKRVFELH